MPMADCISKSDMTETPGMIHPEGNFLSSLWNQISDALPKYSASKTQWWDRNRMNEVAQSCPTLCNAMDYSLPGSSVHGIFQAIVLEWIAISFSRGSSQPRAQTQVSCIVDRWFTIWATREVIRLTEFRILMDIKLWLKSSSLNVL